jgi:hypothetical protein
VLNRTCLALLLSLALAGLACGGDGATVERPQRLSAGEETIVSEAQAAVQAYCRRLGLYVLRRGGPPTAADLQRVDTGLTALVALGREKPRAFTRSQRTAREATGDMLEDVEGSNCSGPVEQRLRQALAGLPAS